MTETPLIIDNYFDDPHQVRNIALQILKEQYSCIINDSGNNYPGIRSSVPDEINNQIISTIKKYVDDTLIEFRSSFHITSSIHKCGLIHNDGERIAGLVYLNENPPEKSGTIICECINEKQKDNVLEFERASLTHDINFIKSFGEFKEEFNQNNFRVIHEIENKFNRFILYDGKSHHAPYYYFGNNLYNSRLVLVFWTDKK